MLISFIIPTYNEGKNIALLVEQLFKVSEEADLDLELVVVDDNSPDGTGKVVDELANSFNITPIHRKGKLGLGSAVIEGFKTAQGEVLGVIDADLSHPPAIIPLLVSPIIAGEADMVIGSRYMQGGGVDVWPFHRKLISLVATWLARPITHVSDPMSGLFAVRKGFINPDKLDVQGYKCGMEIIVKGNSGRIVEVPYTFQNRQFGESKIGISEFKDYLKNLLLLYKYSFSK